MKLYFVSFLLVLYFASRSEARPRRSFFVPANDGNGCGYASCPAYNATAKVIILKSYLTISMIKIIWSALYVFLH